MSSSLGWLPLTSVLVAAACSCSDQPTAHAPPSDAGVEADTSGNGTAGTAGRDTGPPDAPADTGSDAPPDATLPTPDGGDHAWLFDTQSWNKVSHISDCDVWEADLSKLQPPDLDWQPCGPGCLEADVVPGVAEQYTWSNGSAMRNIDGEAYLATSTRLNAGAWVNQVALRRVSDWKAVSMLAEHSNCLTKIAGPASPFLLWVQANTGTPDMNVGVLPSTGGPLSWPQPVISTSYAAFDFIGGWGGVFGFADVAVALTPGSTELTSIYTGGYVDRPAAHGDLVVLPVALGQGGSIVGWSKSQGTQTLATGTWEPVSAAAGPGAILWLGVYGPRVAEGSFERTELWWSPFAREPTGFNATLGPELPIAHLPNGTAVAGDYGAVASRTDANGNHHVYIIHLPSSQVQRIPWPQGTFPQVLGMTLDQLIVAQRTGSDPGYYEKLRRFDLSRLAEYAVPYP